MNALRVSMHAYCVTIPEYYLSHTRSSKEKHSSSPAAKKHCEDSFSLLPRQPYSRKNVATILFSRMITTYGNTIRTIKTKTRRRESKTCSRITEGWAH